MWGSVHDSRAGALNFNTIHEATATMAIEVLPLPQTEAYVDVSILNGGGMLGRSSIIHADEENPHDMEMSCWVFYIYHPTSGKKAIWDVGVSAVSSFLKSKTNLQDHNDYVESEQHIYIHGRAYGPKVPIEVQLEKRTHVKPIEIDSVLFSHAHWYGILEAN
jgi:hypothetical protein